MEELARPRSPSLAGSSLPNPARSSSSHSLHSPGPGAPIPARRRCPRSSCSSPAQPALSQLCPHLLEVVEGRQDDLVAAPHQAHGRQQLQRLGPGARQSHRPQPAAGDPCACPGQPQPLPGVLVVEAQGDLVDGVGMGHDQVEAVLRGGSGDASAVPAWVAAAASPQGHPYLVVHDGPQAHDAEVDVVLLAHQARVLQRLAARQRPVAGGGTGRDTATVSGDPGAAGAAPQAGADPTASCVPEHPAVPRATRGRWGRDHGGDGEGTAGLSEGQRQREVAGAREGQRPVEARSKVLPVLTRRAARRAQRTERESAAREASSPALRAETRARYPGQSESERRGETARPQQSRGSGCRRRGPRTVGRTGTAGAVPLRAGRARHTLQHEGPQRGAGRRHRGTRTARRRRALKVQHRAVAAARGAGTARRAARRRGSTWHGGR